MSFVYFETMNPSLLNKHFMYIPLNITIANDTFILYLVYKEKILLKSAYYS